MGTEIRVRADQENLEQLVMTLHALEIGISAYRSGKQAGWMIISAYLHQLLSDTSRSTTPLLKRLMPDFGFHPLQHDLAGSEALYLLRVDAIVHLGTVFQDIFKLDVRVLPLDIWLEQVIYIQTYQDKGHPISIRKLILASRNQAGGVHFDPKVSLDLHLVEGMFSFFVGDGRPTFRDYLVIVGEYIHARVTYELMGALANGYREQGEFEKAREFLTTALAHAKSAGDMQSQCIQLQNLGLLHSRQGGDEQAIQYYESARPLCQMLNDLETERSILRNLAVCWLNVGNQNFSGMAHAQALEAYEQSIAFTEMTQDKQGLLVALTNSGHLQSRLSNIHEALATMVKAILVFEALEEEQKQSIEMRKAFTRAYKVLHDAQKNVQDFENLLISAIKSIDNGFLGIEQDNDKEQVDKEIREFILESLTQISITISQ